MKSNMEIKSGKLGVNLKRKNPNLSMEVSSVDISGVIDTAADSVKESRFLPSILPALN